MTKFSYLTLFALALGLLGLAGGPAHAFPVMTTPALDAPSPPGLLIPAKTTFHGGFPGGFHAVGHGGRHYNHGHYRGNRYYGRRYYGRRCYGWNGNYCNGYYGGPFIGLGFGSGYYYAQPRYRYTSRHVAWCEGRYKSYNPRKNTWVSKSGKVRKCKSPYWP